MMIPDNQQMVDLPHDRWCTQRCRKYEWKVAASVGRRQVLKESPLPMRKSTVAADTGH